jgi:hypothetical protein
MPRVAFDLSPRGRVFSYVLVAGAAVAAWRWSYLSTATRGLILTVYGLVIATVMLSSAWRMRRQLTTGARAEGTVIDVERHRSKQHENTHHNMYYHAVIEFTTSNGRTVVFTSAQGFESEPDVGGTVPVRYRPDAPEEAEVDSVVAWLVPLVVGVVLGVGGVIAGVAVYLSE